MRVERRTVKQAQKMKKSPIKAYLKMDQTSVN